MKFLIVAALALSAVCADEAKKTEKRGLSGLGYGYSGVGAYGGALGGYSGLGYGSGLGYSGYASPVVSKVAYNTLHDGGYGGYSGYNAYPYSGAVGGYGYGYNQYPVATSYANQVAYPSYSAYGGYGHGYSGLGSAHGYSGLGYGSQGYSNLGYSGLHGHY